MAEFTQTGLVRNAQLNIDEAAPGRFGFDVFGDAEQTDVVRAVVAAVVDWLTEPATALEIGRSVGYTVDGVLDEVVRRLRSEVDRA